MKLAAASETLVNSYQTSRRHITEDGILHSHGWDKLKSHLFLFWFLVLLDATSDPQVT
jgi:hypothetical protein